jgi:hypothetical protein
MLRKDYQDLLRRILEIDQKTRLLSGSMVSGSTGINQLTGDVTAGPGTGSQAATIPNNTVTPAKLDDGSACSVLGRSANSSGDRADIAASTDGQVLRRASNVVGFGAVNLADTDAVTGLLPLANVAARTASIQVTIDGGGSVITTGIKTDLRVPVACTIIRAVLLADQSGSIVIDVWKDSYTNYPPTDADSITASAPPTISTATKSKDSTLTGWTTSISADDTLRFNVDSATTVTRVQLELEVTVP